MTREEWKALERAAEGELKRIPGVIAVTSAYKEVGGEVTDLLALRVYVHEKKPRSAVAAGELIPETFRGVPTDVMIVPEGSLLGTPSRVMRSPLVSGVHIHVPPPRLIRDGEGTVHVDTSAVGSLGCFARKLAHTNQHEAFLLTANHVLSRSPPSDPVRNDSVHHGDLDVHYMTTSGSAIQTAGTFPNLIGNVADSVPMGLRSQAGVDYWMDCALAKLRVKVCESSNSNCGVSYRNAFHDQTQVPAIHDVAEANHLRDENVVWKVGALTGFTEGRVNTTGALFSVAGLPQGQCIEIRSVDASPFAMKGDSGSAVMDSAGNIVGIISGGIPHNAPTRVYACHIHPVIDALGIEILTQTNRPTAPAGSSARSDALGRIQAEHFQRVREVERRFLESGRGRGYWNLIEAHRDEVVRLVNYQRKVTVTWHRNQGPAFMNRAISNARDPSVQIPTSIAGVEATNLLRSMSTVLKAKGSPELRRTLEEHEEGVLAYERYFGDARALAEEFLREAKAKERS